MSPADWDTGDYDACAIHGLAFTHGCPGCEAIDDALDAQLVRRLDRWWTRDNLCRRFVGHWQRKLETDVYRCRICKSITFAAVTLEQLERHLGVDS